MQANIRKTLLAFSNLPCYTVIQSYIISKSPLQCPSYLEFYHISTYALSRNLHILLIAGFFAGMQTKCFYLTKNTSTMYKESRTFLVMLLKYIDLIFATKQGIKRTKVNTQSLIKDLIGYNTFKIIQKTMVSINKERYNVEETGYIEMLLMIDSEINYSFRKQECFPLKTNIQITIGKNKLRRGNYHQFRIVLKRMTGITAFLFIMLLFKNIFHRDEQKKENILYLICIGLLEKMKLQTKRLARSKSTQRYHKNTFYYEKLNPFQLNDETISIGGNDDEIDELIKSIFHNDKYVVILYESKSWALNPLWFTTFKKDMGL
ncbi:hypothetical protein H8356DRAFT_1327469 [Neocallimastix lanati (nom. inval.)]|nr:hypothetical protein H8356DRAFT_1327469 [Neocallimastix sp. JGI-2020a]